MDEGEGESKSNTDIVVVGMELVLWWVEAFPHFKARRVLALKGWWDEGEDEV